MRKFVAARRTSWRETACVPTELQACVACGGALEPACVKDGFELVSCRACGLLMRRTLPDRDELEQIYAPEYFAFDADSPVDGYADYLADAERHRETARRRLALLDRFGPARGKLLDVGAAAGFFVDEARRAGWNAEGVDVAAHMVEWGRRELGAPLRVGGIADASGTYAAVTMWDYIEHSLDPAGELAKANALLVPGGIVALSTGDRDSFAARVSRSRWHLLTPRHHNFFFSGRTMARLLARTGFDVVWTGHPGARYSVGHLAYKALPNTFAKRLAGTRLARYSLPVNLFDIVTVVARRERQSPR
jgi:SAM-dependent methyltransferase